MSTEMETATVMVAALNAKDIEAALVHLTEDVELETPMGPRKGKSEARQMLNMMASMGQSVMAAPLEEAGEIFSTSETPMGTIKVVFEFTGGAISAFRMRR